MHQDLETLKSHADRLHSLLADPHPGLFTWNEMVAGRWKEIVELWKECNPNV